MNEPTSSYDPPYDSPLEDSFALNLDKYVNPLLGFRKQTRVETMCGPFIIDFTTRIDADVIGFECDGAEFHDKFRDEWRDAMLLGARKVTTIYHLRGKDLHYRMEDCLYIISKLEPNIFSDRGKINLERLASDRVLEHDLCRHADHIVVSYPEESQGTDPLFLAIDRRSRHWPAGERRFWTRLYDFAAARGGGNLDALIADYKREQDLG